MTYAQHAQMIVEYDITGIPVLSRDCTLLVEYGGQVYLTLKWARSLLKRMGYVKRKATTHSPF